MLQRRKQFCLNFSSNKTAANSSNNRLEKKIPQFEDGVKRTVFLRDRGRFRTDQDTGNTPCCRQHLVHWTHGEAETSGRQSVLVSPPEYSTIHHYKVWLESGLSKKKKKKKKKKKTTRPKKKKNVTAEKFMRWIRPSDQVKSCDIGFWFDIDATRSSAGRVLALQIEVNTHDITWSHRGSISWISGL